MQYALHALLNCVAWFSLLACGNAARGTVPSEVLSHFAHTWGTVLVPTLANEIHGSRLNRTTTQKLPTTTHTANRRQLDTRQLSPRDSGNPGLSGAPGAPENINSGAGLGQPNGLPFPRQQQGFGPYQFERTYQLRYPIYSQQLANQNFFPGGVGGAANFNGLPIDPRFFHQAQLGGINGLAPIQSDLPKQLSANINGNGNNNLKENGNNNANSIQNLDPNVDSKSSAQNRPFNGEDFSTIPVSANQGGGVGSGAGGLDPSNGNLRVNNRFSAIDYERVRQNYYSDPPINQQRNYYNFNEIPFGGGAGGAQAYRSPLSERYSNLQFNGAGGVGQGGGPSLELRSGNGHNGLGNPYFGSFLQGPYQSLAYNSLPGSNGGGVGSGGASSIGNGGADGGSPFSEDFERGGCGGGPSNLRSPFGGGLQYHGTGFNGAFYPRAPGGGIGGGFGNSSLRASSAKETLSSASENSSQESREEDEGDVEDRETVDREQKVRYVNADANSKLRRNQEEKENSSSRASVAAGSKI